jgi:hypothetical protein
MNAAHATRLLVTGLMIALAPLAATATAAAPQAASTTPVIDGEKFVKHELIDQQQGGMTAGWMFAPAKWKFDSRIEWHYDWFDNPVVISCSVQSPASAEAYYSFPQVVLEWIEVPAQLQRYEKHPPQPGTPTGGGAINLQPRPPLDTLALFVKRTRGNEPNAHPIGKKNLPDLAKALGVADLPNSQGVAIKIGYDLDGKPVEEAFFAVYYLSSGHGPGPAAALTQTNWGLAKVHSFRAPAGELDKRLAVFAAIEKSFQPNPDWVRRVQAVRGTLQQQVAQKIKQGYAQIEASHQVMQQVMANEAAFDKQIAQFDASLRANPAAGGSGGGRSVWDKFDDNIRGVDTVDDPFWGQSQHSNLEKYHWTDGYGNYVNSNDPNYNPSADNPGNWQLMQESK